MADHNSVSHDDCKDRRAKLSRWVLGGIWTALAIFATASAASDVPPELVNKTRNATFIVYLKESSISSGTAIRYQGQTLLLACDHSMQPPPNVFPFAFPLANFVLVVDHQEIPVRSYQRLGKLDLGIIVPDGELKLNPAELRRGEPVPVGTEIYHAGYYGYYRPGQPIGFTRGMVSRVGTESPKDGRTYDELGIAAGRGSSGGGVYDSEGRLVGVITQAFSCTQYLMLPVRQIIEALEGINDGENRKN